MSSSRLVGLPFRFESGQQRLGRDATVGNQLAAGSTHRGGERRGPAVLVDQYGGHTAGLEHLAHLLDIFRGSPGEGEVYRTLATEARLGWRELEDRRGQKLIDWRTALIIGPPTSAFVAGSLSRPNGLPLSAVDIARRTNGGVTVP